MTAETGTFCYSSTLPLITVLQMSFGSTKNHVIKLEIFSLEPWMSGTTKINESWKTPWISGLLESLVDLEGPHTSPMESMSSENSLGDTDAGTLPLRHLTLGRC